MNDLLTYYNLAIRAAWYLATLRRAEADRTFYEMLCLPIGVQRLGIISLGSLLFALIGVDLLS